LAISKPTVVIACMFGSSESWGFSSAHIHGTHVPVEEPSTATIADITVGSFDAPSYFKGRH
jgi:hypothetical protein